MLVVGKSLDCTSVACVNWRTLKPFYECLNIYFLALMNRLGSETRHGLLIKKMTVQLTFINFPMNVPETVNVAVSWPIPDSLEFIE